MFNGLYVNLVLVGGFYVKIFKSLHIRDSVFFVFSILTIGRPC